MALRIRAAQPERVILRDLARIQTPMNTKRKFRATEARAVAEELLEALDGYCERALICGSLRREKSEVGDVEIVYVPKFEMRAKDLFGEVPVNVADKRLNCLVAAGTIQKRPNKNGLFAWGEQNKLAVHCRTGIPVDFFATPGARWWLTVVIRTGPREFNLRLIDSAAKRGVKFHAYGMLEHIGNGEPIPCESERAVLEACGLPWMEPWERH